jgi:hypothetical protein
MASQEQRYTCGIAGQAITLTPKTASESKPIHAGASTIVFNTASAVTGIIADFWGAKYEYHVIIHRLTKTN